MSNLKIYIIAYDISDNKKRNRIAKLLQQFGYERMQFSLFAGLSSPRSQKGLWEKLEKVADTNAYPENRLICLLVAKSAFENCKIMGTLALDLSYIMGVKNTEFI